MPYIQETEEAADKSESEGKQTGSADGAPSSSRLDEDLAFHRPLEGQGLRDGLQRLAEIAFDFVVPHVHQDDGRGPDTLQDDPPGFLVLEEKRVEEGDVDFFLFPGDGIQEGYVRIGKDVALMINRKAP